LRAATSSEPLVEFRKGCFGGEKLFTQRQFGCEL